jgi:hypothetical protein
VKKGVLRAAVATLRSSSRSGPCGCRVPQYTWSGPCAWVGSDSKSFSLCAVPRLVPSAHVSNSSLLSPALGTASRSTVISLSRNGVFQVGHYRDPSKTGTGLSRTRCQCNRRAHALMRSYAPRPSSSSHRMGDTTRHQAGTRAMESAFAPTFPRSDGITPQENHTYMLYWGKIGGWRAWRKRTCGGNYLASF